MRGQTDMTKLIVAFRNFVNAPKKSHFTVFILIEANFFPSHVSNIAKSTAV